MQIAERQAPLEGVAFWDRPLFRAVPISREAALYVALFVVAAALRFWDLGARMLHHDESLHATYSYYLYIGRGYRHDPMMHGPWQFTIMAFSYFLFGASEAAARVPHALFGSLLTVMPFFIRKYLGRTGALVAATFLAFSPSFLYFTRFAREDALMIGWTMLLVVAMIRYLDQRRDVDLYVLAAAFSLGFCTKENAYILAGIVVLFLLLLSVGRHGGELLSLLRGPVALSPAGDLVVVLATLSLPLFAGFLALPMRILRTPPATQTTVLTLALAALVVVSAIIGGRWDRERWGRAAAIFWGIFVVLYTTFFSNPGGIYSGAIGSVTYWVEQQGFARGGQPWYYYLLIIPLYEYVVVIFGIAGIFYWLRRRNVLATFLIWWIVSTQIIYAYTSEKMPWLVLHLTLPLVLLAGMTVGRLFDRISWRQAIPRGGAWFILMLIVAFASAFSLTGRALPNLSALSTIASQQALFEWLGIVAVIAVLAGIAAHFGRAIGRRASGQMAVVAALIVLMLFSVRTAFMAAYEHGDIPDEMLVYTQTSPDVGLVMNQIETIAYRTGVGKDGLKVAYDSGVSWPFEFYLRDYKSRNFYGSGLPDADAPIVLASFDDNTDTRVKAFLGNRYVGQRYRLRAWFDESTYREIGSDPSILWRAIVNPDARQKLWRFLLYREPLKPSGSTDFMVYVRRDLASGPWAAPLAAGAASPDADQYAAKARQIPAVLSFGSKGSGLGQLDAPKGVAVASDGSVYVTDGANNRVARFDSAGHPLLSWGGPGQGDGQFSEPWGIAVDKQGLVYVADTWNHRIQVFDSQGQFIAKWATPGLLFGPRAVALTPKGEVLVSDAGHHRIVVFDAKGNQVAQFGGRGSGLGLFAEPVGLAVDSTGNIYVADTWNQRIQKFDSSFSPVAEWPIEGWDGQSVLNKPYLATDAAGNVYATDPEGYRVLKLSSSGSLQAVWGQAGSDASSFQLPLGIAVDARGNVLVVDSQNNRVEEFGPIQ